MSTLKVTVEPLTVYPHPNADRLELAQVGLYRAVVAKGAFRTGELALYIPEQAVLPLELIEELGLTGKLAGGAANRVKAVRLRGELSQGIVCRPSALTGLDWAAAHADGTDFARDLGIVKWAPPIPLHMTGAAVSGSDLLKWVDIENLERYPNAFDPGEQVVATEKIHGCLHGRVRVLMPDGSHRCISDLVRSSYRGNVLGMNEHGQMVETPVLATFDNGRTTDWLRVEVSRRGAAGGAVTMTMNHRVYSPSHIQADSEGFVLAGHLKVDDEVWVTPQGKEVPGSVVDRIGPVALAFWYMDDGSLSPHVDRLDTDAAERLFLLVAPHVPESMQHKLPERHRGGVAGLPRAFGESRPMVRPQRVTALTPVSCGSQGKRASTTCPRGSVKYDMQTGIGNYFANGMLVHNSCTVLTYVAEDDRLLVSSKGLAANGIALKEAEANLYWRAVRRYELEQVLRRLCEESGAERVAVYGEVYGSGVQDLHYRVDARTDDGPGFAAFDVRLDVAGAPRWLDAPVVLETLARHGVPTVPVLYQGAFDLDTLLTVASGPSVLGGGAHLREGVVVRPRQEGWSEVLGGRKIVKLVSPAYLMRGGNPTEYE